MSYTIQIDNIDTPKGIVVRTDDNGHDDDDYDVDKVAIDGKWKNVLTSSSNGRATERVVAKANRNNVKRPKQGLIMISARQEKKPLQ